MTKVELEPRGEGRPTMTVEATLDDREDILNVMEVMVVEGTDIGEKTVSLLSVKELAECYSAVVDEMNT